MQFCDHPPDGFIPYRMFYIYAINQSDDPKASIALYPKSDEIPDINVRAWMMAYLPIGSKARLNVTPSYGICISYYSPEEHILYESEVIPVTESGGVFRVVRSGQEIKLLLIDALSSSHDIVVEVEKKVERLIYINIIRNKQVYFSFPVSPGSIPQFKLHEQLFISKVRPDLVTGSELITREMLFPSRSVEPGQTVILTGTADRGYDFVIRHTIFSDFISL